MKWQLGVGLAMAAVSARVSAQTSEPVEIAGDFFQSSFGPHVAMQPAVVRFSAGMGVAAPVKGAPYSAEGVTEFVQTLSDGTRITRKSVTKMARDSDGRTRNEQGGTVAGPIGAEMEQLIVINDPTIQENIYLHEREKTADRVSMGRADAQKVLALQQLEKAEVQQAKSQLALAQAEMQRRDLETRAMVIQRAVPVPPAPPAPPGTSAAGVAVAMSGPNYAYTAIAVMPGGKEALRESLGKQMVAGVSCDTTRITNSIPAGQIGNDREIRVFTETCVSPELKITLYSRTVDPMNGETTYRIASLSRAEPAKSLFQVPAGYTVTSPSTPVPPAPPEPLRK